jgi:hypothetical protein
MDGSQGRPGRYGEEKNSLTLPGIEPRPFGPCYTYVITNNSVDLVRERTIPTERPRLSAKLVPTFADRGVSRNQRGGSPTAVISVYYTGAATVSFK